MEFKLADVEISLWRHIYYMEFKLVDVDVSIELVEPDDGP